MDDTGGMRRAQRVQHLDDERNAVRSKQTRVISPDDAPVTVLVVPTNEELEIARQTLEVARAV